MGVRDRLQKALGGEGTPLKVGDRTVVEVTQVTDAAMIDQRMLNNPFSPGQPIAPFDGFSGTPRSQDFPTGFNIQARPRLNEQVAFSTLKGLINNYDVAQQCIRHRIDSIRSLDYMLLPMKGYNGPVSDYVAVAEMFLSKPDRERPFHTWLAKWLFDVLAYDAGTLFKMRNNAGRPVGLRVLDGTCYTDDTEILTERGWISFDQIDMESDRFATRNQKTHALEWQPAHHFHEADWDGEIYRIKSRTLDLAVTPNHRVLVSTGNGREKFLTAEELHGLVGGRISGRYQIPATSSWDAPDLYEFVIPPTGTGYDTLVTMEGVREARKALGFSQPRVEVLAGLSHQTYWAAENGKRVRIRTAEAIARVLTDVTWTETGTQSNVKTMTGDDFAAFMGMWLSEGSLNGDTPYVYVSQRNFSKGFQDFEDLLTRVLGSTPSHDGSSWRFKHQALANYLRQFGKSWEKFVPDLILNMSARQLGIFWRFYMLGDGCYDDKRERIITSSSRMADDLQEIAQKLGYSASVRERKLNATPSVIKGRPITPRHPSYQVTLRSSASQQFTTTKDTYRGKVYCVSVPNETLYVRRNGYPAWCGNTIAPMLDGWGNRPTGDAPAFVQFAQGVPWEWLGIDDVIYEPLYPVNDSPYGKAAIETILLNANTDLRFQQYFLNRFTEGNVPEAFASAPETWTPTQIAEYQEIWDALMYSDDTRKHQIRFVPGGMKFAWSNEKPFDDKFSLFLMRKTAAAFHVVPQDLGFTEDVNRATGEVQVDVQARVGEGPLLSHINSMFTRFIQDDLGLPLEFRYKTGREVEDMVTTAQANKIYIETGVISASEVREDVFGLGEPDNIPVPRFVLTTRSGPIPLSAIAAVAGPIDKDTAAPDPTAALPHQPFQPIEGVSPASLKARPALAVQAFPSENAADAPIDPTTPPSPYPVGPPQPPLPVAKADAPGGIGFGTGADGSPLMADGTKAPDEDEYAEIDGTHEASADSVFGDRPDPAMESESHGYDRAAGLKAGDLAGERGKTTRGKVNKAATPGINFGTVGGNPFVGGHYTPAPTTSIAGRSPDPTDPNIYNPDPDPFRLVALGVVDQNGVPQANAAMVKEMRAFRTFVKKAANRGRYRDFEFGEFSPEHAVMLNKAAREYVEVAKETDAGDQIVPRDDPNKVNVAGLCLKAVDTGRVLMLQRGLTFTDPAAGKWEFPGGHLEDGEDHRTAAIREWQEETGCRFPPNAEPMSEWVEDNGYHGFVYRVPQEAEVDINTRTHFIPNPDNPTSDLIETSAWWNPQDIRDNPAVRKELRESSKRVLKAIMLDGVQTMAKTAWADSTLRKIDTAVEHHAPLVQEAMRELVDRTQLRAAVSAYLETMPDRPVVKDAPAPTINVTVQMPEQAGPTITVEPAQVNVEKADAPVINVEAPVVNIQPPEVTVNVEAPVVKMPKQEPPTVNVDVAAPNVTVEGPPSMRKSTKITRDRNGLITGSEETLTPNEE